MDFLFKKLIHNWLCPVIHKIINHFEVKESTNQNSKKVVEYTGYCDGYPENEKNIFKFPMEDIPEDILASYLKHKGVKNSEKEKQPQKVVCLR